MNPETQLLHTVWAKNKDHIAASNIDLDRVRLDELIASVFSNGPFYFYIIDFSDMKIKYMSSSITKIHGLEPEATTFQDILDQIHPDDLPFIAKAEEKAWRIGTEMMGTEQYEKYKVSYCFRMRRADGSYRLFNHQAMVLTKDEKGGLSKSLNIHTDISHLTSENNHKISIIGLFDTPSYLNLDVWNDRPLPKPVGAFFTKRESEVIRLLSEGLTSDKIAKRLFISSDTVKTHRKNIMIKSGCKSVGQLITRCITEGLI